MPGAVHWTTTDPAASVLSRAELESDRCALDGLPNSRVGLRGTLRELGFSLRGVGDGGRAYGTDALRNGIGAATVDLVDDAGTKITDVTVTVALREAGPRERETYRERGFHIGVGATPYIADITVTTGDGRHGTVTCEAWYVAERVIDTPNGDDGGH